MQNSHLKNEIQPKLGKSAFREELYAAHFVVNDGAGKVVCSLDLPELSYLRLTFLMSAEQLAIIYLRTGAPLQAVQIPDVVIPQHCTMTSAILREKISTSDIVTVENSLVLTVRDIMKGRKKMPRSLILITLLGSLYTS